MPYLVPTAFLRSTRPQQLIRRVDKEIGKILHGKLVLDPRQPLTRYRTDATGVWIDFDGLGKVKPFPKPSKPFNERLKLRQLFSTSSVFPNKDEGGTLHRAVSRVLMKK